MRGGGSAVDPTSSIPSKHLLSEIEGPAAGSVRHGAAAPLVVMPNWVGEWVDGAAGARSAGQDRARDHGARQAAWRRCWVWSNRRAHAAAVSRTTARRCARCGGGARGGRRPATIHSVHAGPFRAGSPTRGLRGQLRAPICAAGASRGPAAQVEEYGEMLAAMGIAPPAGGRRIDRRGAARAGRERLERAKSRSRRAAGGPVAGRVRPQQALAMGALRRVGARPAPQTYRRADRDSLGSERPMAAVRVHEESGKLHPVIGPDLDSRSRRGCSRIWIS